MTLAILIGNSDDKLSQAEWARYIADTDHEIRRHANGVHFVGFTPPTVRWQTACWVIAAIDHNLSIGSLDDCLARLAARHHQDSIAVVDGTTRFVEASRAGTSPPEPTR